MVKPSNKKIINDLKQDLDNLIVKHKFNLVDPQIIELSIKINSLLTPLFEKQLTTPKVINFPQ